MKNRQQKIIDLFTSKEHAETTGRLFARWLAAPVEREEKDAAMAALWERVPAESPRTASALRRVHRRLFGKPAVISMPRTRFIRWAVAAAVVPIMLFAAAFAYLHTRTTEPAEWMQYAVPYGERGELTLADGTRLWVGARTRVVYPAAFEGRERKIFVDGEVYAEVARDEEHPFVIATSDADVRVLGTTFDLRAYDSDAEAELMLVEGRVDFELHGAGGDRVVELLPGDMVRYNRTDGSCEKYRFHAAGYRSWAKDGSLYFYNESLNNIVSLLSRRFARQIVITDPELQSLQFHVFLGGSESLEDVLENFAMNKSIRISEYNGIIYLSKRGQR